MIFNKSSLFFVYTNIYMYICIMKNKIKKLLRESLEENYINVFHGTNEKFAEDIKSKGLTADNYQSPNWFMVSTDFESALFHSTPKEEGIAYVFEFKIPVDNSKWIGYPFFWKSYDRNESSKWYALKQLLNPEFIINIHKVNYDEFLKQKNKGY